jgi:hypothetical protein
VGGLLVLLSLLLPLLLPLRLGDWEIGGSGDRARCGRSVGWC